MGLNMGPKIGTRFGSANTFTIKTAKSEPHSGAKNRTQNGTRNRAKNAKKTRRRASELGAKSEAILSRVGWAPDPILVSSDPSPMPNLSLKLATCW